VNRGLPPLRFAPRLRGSHHETRDAVAIGSPVRVARGVRQLQIGACSNKRIGRECPAPLPVTTAIVEAKDFPVYRVGLGTVQASNTVTVKVRVDGEIQKIAFREGQDVRLGDLLAHRSGSARWVRRILPRIRA
jgi:multidrug efflux pump subunit AcrA (membrane-fusion protein)